MNDDALIQLLTMVLIIMLSVLVVLVIFLAFAKFKTKKKEENFGKIEENKNKTKTPGTEVVKSYDKQSIFDFMEFDKIDDNMIIQKNGARYLMAIKCQGINYDLMSEMDNI